MFLAVVSPQKPAPPRAKTLHFRYSSAMAIESILAQIDQEIARLQQARSLLTNLGSASFRGAGTAKKASGKPRKKRVLSADARKRIADAQRKRWAAQRAKSKSK
jgi:50S ribosomal subunit-associated GTPase HflX